MTIELSALLKLCDSTTPGPWITFSLSAEWSTPTIEKSTGGIIAQMTHYGKMRDDSKFISQMNPQTAKKIIQALLVAREALEHSISDLEDLVDMGADNASLLYVVKALKRIEGLLK